jgi:mitochondrial cardiolipin hydrolase
MQEIENLIKSTFDDFVITKSEKKLLKNEINLKGLNERELAVLRSNIFGFAKSKIENVSPDLIIDWIENVNKLILPETEDKEESYVNFSPGVACRSSIIQHIKLSKNSIKVCVFTISDDLITKELILAHNRGVSVKVITDNDKSFDLGSDIEELANKGLPVKIDNTSNHMHHKFCIFDKKVVITGSYNWTRSAAERNQENILINKESGVVKSFLKEFDKLWDSLSDY